MVYLHKEHLIIYIFIQDRAEFKNWILKTKIHLIP